MNRKFQIERGDDLFGEPPEIVPDDLTGTEYYELGLWYLDKERFEHCRQAFFKALALLDPKDPTTTACRRLLNSRVPSRELPKAVTDKLAAADLEIAFRRQSALKTVRKVLAEYPDCEWAHRIMAEACLVRGQLDECFKALDAALNINPNYLPALSLKARALTIDMQYEQAQHLLAQALGENPGDERLRDLQRSLHFLTYMEQEELPL